MVKMGLALAVALVALAGAAAPLAAVEDRPLRVGVDANYPPLAYRREDGRLEGFDVDVAYAICAEIERACTLVPTAFADVIDRVRQGRIDLAVVSMSITPQRSRLVAFSLPYYRAPTRFVARTGPSAAVPPAGPTGRRIGVRQGTTFERYARDVLATENTVVGYSLQNEIYLDLVLGRLDLALGNGLTMRAGFIDTPLGVGFDTVGAPLVEPAFFGAGEAVTLRRGDVVLKQRIDDAIRRLTADGGLAEIWDRYFDVPFAAADLAAP